MNRRGFLSGLIALPVVSYFLPPVNGWPTGRVIGKDLNQYFTSNTAWFLKTEAKDGLALYSRAHPILSAAFRAAMAEGLNQVWSEVDAERADDWVGIYGSADISNALDPDSLEEIEIELARPADAAGRTRRLFQTQRVAIADATPGRSYQSERAGGILVPRLPRFRKEDTR